ncbi:GNAT family N-acetyltransferase [Sediminibacillus massiliensis]|uniref:GNAT family N-acetyltransferase n=1 Tax=Sediminibacillus massiliensis TaxID=1926277 RepID=UPI0009886428|nr:GNAT family protein [Sediminibacillus massiliensis]
MLTLEFFEREDFNLLMSWIDSPETTLKWSGPAFDFPLTIEQLNAYIRDANQEGSEEFIYKAIEQETGEVVGHISLGKVDRQHETGRIGKVFVKEGARGNGYGREMVELMLKKGFNELSLNRISLGVFDFNTSAIKSYEKAGFQKEGLFREVRKMKDTYWSSYEMSILKREWLQR